MRHLPRLTPLILIGLLTACASPPPAPPPSQPAIVFSDALPAPAADDVLFRALGLVGTPYRYGGNTPEGGFDCSGLIGFVYRDAAGIQLPRSTREMIGLQAPQVSPDALRSGDLVFFATGGGRQVSHAGIYVGEGRFVHAPSSGGTVRLDSLASGYWRNSYLQAKRILLPSDLARTP